MTSEIIKYAKNFFPSDTKVIVTTLDNNAVKLNRVLLALNEAINKGYWVVIEDASSQKKWPKELLKFIYVNYLELLF